MGKIKANVEYTLAPNQTNKSLEDVCIKLNHSYVQKYKDNPNENFDPKLLWDWVRDGNPIVVNSSLNSFKQIWKYVGENYRDDIFEKFLQDLGKTEVVTNLDFKFE